MTKEQLKKQILQQIDAGKTVMKPRWHFVLKGVAISLGIILLACFMLFLTSFVFFVLQQTGMSYAPTLGFGGVFIFFRSLPWVIILLAVLLFIVLEYLVQRYSFAYRKPIIVLVIVLVLFTVFGSALIARNTIHQRIATFSEQREGSRVGGLYNMAHKVPKDFHVGVVVEVLDTDTFVLKKQREDEVVQVLISEETRIKNKKALVSGVRVIVLGENVAGVIDAKGVRVILKPTSSQKNSRVK